jgi:F0F1-type ATP synthase delta subunit
VQDELKLTAEQRENLDEALQGRFDDAVKLIQKLGGVNPEERRITV